MISRRILRIKILQILYAYYKNTDSGLNKAEKELFHSINKTYELYHFLLIILVDIVNYAIGRIEIAKQKNIPTHEDLYPNTKFIENKIIQQIRSNKQLNSFLNSNRLSWVNYPELIKKIFNQIKDSEQYQSYLSDNERSYKEDKEFIAYLYTEIIANTGDLYQSLEEQSIYWNDEVEFVISIILKTIKNFKEKDGENAHLFPLFKNNDDIEFTKTLFRKTALHKEEYLELIKSFAQNWEIERIAFMDVLILQLAITEVTEFTSIPTKVTFNEYLEIAKYYSTNKSSVFINGILDKIITHLKNNDKIKKHGRGLIGEV
jgi:transcription antitermination protein NusB